MSVRLDQICPAAADHFLFADDVLKKLSGKLKRDEFQAVQQALKTANSVLGDELEHIHDGLVEEARQAKLTAKYLGTLRRPIDALDRIKIHAEVIRGQQIPPLVDLPAVYQGKK